MSCRCVFHLNLKCAVQISAVLLQSWGLNGRLNTENYRWPSRYFWGTPGLVIRCYLKQLDVSMECSFQLGKNVVLFHLDGHATYLIRSRFLKTYFWCNKCSLMFLEFNHVYLLSLSMLKWTLCPAGMKVLKRSVLGVTVLLLVCQVTASQLCKSVTVLMDGFHTLFILVSIALTAESTSRVPLGSSLEVFASPLHACNLSAGPPIKPHLGAQASGTLRQVCPPALGCGLSYRQCRIPIVGSFISALVLASLCLSSTIDIIGLFLEPRQVWLPLLLVLISSSSVLLKMLFLWLYWDHFADTLLRLNRKGDVL